MLAARGVSLGLGKINLSELNQLPVSDRALLGKLKKKATENKPKLRIKKHVDKKVGAKASKLSSHQLCNSIF
ncbi:hypothetical protein M3Y94_00518600 [Aphelenchoides besseyi]|nr:hypothetical protein M3Y94_00518600 [Aphelenchoides besseyi]